MGYNLSGPEKWLYFLKPLKKKVKAVMAFMERLDDDVRPTGPVSKEQHERLDISSLVVSQDGVHTASQIPAMIEHVQNGGVFNRALLDDWAYLCNKQPAPLVKITFFPDGLKLIQDGHHRIMSIYMGGRDHILPEEFVTEEWDYSNYLGVNPVRKWVTPYDPRLEVRLPDFKKYKELALEVYQASLEKDVFDGWPKDKADHFARKALLNFAHENSDLYRKPRNVHTIMDLVEAYERLHGPNHSSERIVSRVPEG